MIGMETFGLVGPSMATCLDLIRDPFDHHGRVLPPLLEAQALSPVVGS